MRTVEIGSGSCYVVAEWFKATCPVCLAVIRPGAHHQCRVPQKDEADK